MLLVQRKQLTLMEVIAVMVIIVLLITIIIPVVVKGREWGTSIACKSNIKNIGTAYLGYSVDWDGYAPQEYSTFGTVSWFGNLVKQGYLPDEKINVYDFSYPMNFPYHHVLYTKIVSLNYRAYFPYYSCVYACPSLPIGEYAWRNEWLAGLWGAGTNGSVSSNRAFYWSTGSHYVTNTQLANAFYWKQKVTNSLGFRAQDELIVGDGSGGMWGGMLAGGSSTLYNNATNPMKQMYWGRHFGKPVNVSSANINSSSWNYYGSGKMNMMMLDGHMESRNCIEVQKFPRAW